MRRNRRHHRLSCEGLEARDLLTAIPFGATSQDAAEFMLGTVNVNVVLLESDNSIDSSSEDWTPELIAGVKANVEEGLQWWTDALASYSDVHSLDFQVDYTYADAPVETGYEPINRKSDDFLLWIEDFFREVGTSSSAGFSTDIRSFNHQTRVANDTNWSFTIFVVNADNDPDGRFDLSGSFSRAFAYAGGRFFVMPHHRPASTVAHETGHMFWAFDEYSGSEPYGTRRGYYGTRNTNGATGHPNPTEREPSIMSSTGTPFANHEISRSAREMIGWRDSDGDGIFDVLDVDHSLSGQSVFDDVSRTLHFTGLSSVNTLPNRNTEGERNNITLNKITDLQYRVDAGEWTDLASLDGYQVQIDATTPTIPELATLVELRTIDNRTGVTSNIHSVAIHATPSPWQNPSVAEDVNADGHVSPIDALLVIIEINRQGSFTPTTNNLPFLDVSGDRVVSPVDALRVINFINTGKSLDKTPVNPLPPQKVAPAPRPAASAIAAALASSEPESAETDFWNPSDDEDLLLMHL